MTEHDRGAYTPPSDVPLAFDPRRAGERRPAPMMLVASFAVLLVLVAAVFMALRHAPRPAGPVRPVGASVSTIKSAPGLTGNRSGDSAEGVDVFASQNVPANATGAPRLAPAPEAPQPRPAAPQLQVRSVSPAPVRIEPASPAVASTTTTTVSSARIASAAARGASTVISPGIADAVAPRHAVERAPPRSLAADRAATTTVDAALARSSGPPTTPDRATAAAPWTGGAGVQIGAYSSHALADQGFSDAGALMGAAMAGKGKSITPVPRNGKTLFRTVITGFADHAAARAFCASLTAKGSVCIVKG